MCFFLIEQRTDCQKPGKTFEWHELGAATLQPYFRSLEWHSSSFFDDLENVPSMSLGCISCAEWLEYIGVIPDSRH